MLASWPSLPLVFFHAERKALHGVQPRRAQAAVIAGATAEE
jgi:hypothetical protein